MRKGGVMAKRSRCEHGQPPVQMNGCGHCVAEAMAGFNIVRAARQAFGMDAADIVNLIRKDQGLPPLREEGEELSLSSPSGDEVQEEQVGGNDAH